MGISPSCILKNIMTADSSKPKRSVGMEQYMAAPQEWFSDRLYSTFRIGLWTNGFLLIFTPADFKSPVQNECSERSLQLKYFPHITICCRHLPVVCILQMLTYVQKNKRLKEEPYSLAQICRQREPQSMLPEANLSCTMTKLFVPVAAQKHEYYSLRIHMTFNLFQYIHSQSMIISLHVSDICL